MIIHRLNESIVVDSVLNCLGELSVGTATIKRHLIVQNVGG